MPLTKKNNTHKRAKKMPPTVVVVTKTQVPAKDAIFPEKIKKVKDVLTKAKFRPS